MTDTKKPLKSTGGELDVKAAAQMFRTTVELLAEMGLVTKAVVRDRISGEIMGIRIALPVGTWNLDLTLKDDEDEAFLPGS